MSDDRDGTQSLIARCLDGVASDAEVAELGLLIARDPQVARRFAAAARLESNLEIVMRGASPASVAPAPVAPSRPRSRAGWLAAATITAAAAAAALIWSGGAKRRDAELTVAASTFASRPAADPAMRVRFTDGSTADLRDAASRLETRLATETAIDTVLAQGAARFEVVPRPGRRFRIWVGAVYVEVIGTIFTVERLPAGVRVSVERGAVKVVSGDNEMRLSEGTAEVVPFAAVEAAEKPRERAQKPTSRADVPRDEVGALLRASESARRSGHPEDALVFLERLLDHHPRDPRAAYAAFILGRVLLEELRRPGQAAAAFARVAALDAKTPLVQDALAREVESWARAGDLARARDRARAYLARYPDGRRADEVRRYSRME
jgi:ferric-dicitrate binding protein FerR (iron transport regulator)